MKLTTEHQIRASAVIISYLPTVGGRNAKRSEKGVGVSLDSVVKCVKCTAHSPRNAVGWFEVCGTKLKLVSTYAPTEKANEKEFLEYLEELSMTLTAKVDCKDNYLLIVLRDFKAALGRERSAILQRTVGSFTIADETRKNGMLLSEWCLENNLRVENTFFRNRS